MEHRDNRKIKSFETKEYASMEVNKVIMIKINLFQGFSAVQCVRGLFCYEVISILSDNSYFCFFIFLLRVEIQCLTLDAGWEPLCITVQ